MDTSANGCLTVSTLSVHNLDDLVWMDQSAFLALKIFSEQSHPSSFKKGQASSAKEGENQKTVKFLVMQISLKYFFTCSVGLSLFGIASKCYSSPGFLHLRYMLENVYFTMAAQCETLHFAHARNMFLRPTRSIETLKERYSVIRFCKQAANLEVVHNLIDCLRNISNIKV